jgi:carbonic anhydrase/acetyltransferase-like protein (isoleucine patch superfamily)
MRSADLSAAARLHGSRRERRSILGNEMTAPHDDLMELYRALRGATQERWNRDLPFQDLLTDRWERAAQLGFGEGSSIYQSAYVYGDVAVGAGTWIGPMVLLDGTGGLRIGSGCDISAGVQIYTHDTVARVLSEGRNEIEHAPVAIEDHTHIGAQAVIVKGVTVGHHSVIGASSFVNRDVPPYTVAVGVPCRPVGRVEVDGDGAVSLRYD